MRARAVRQRSKVNLSVNEQVRVEIRIFLQALHSYAARAATDPEITFEEHQARLMEVSGAAPPCGQRNQEKN